MEKIIDSFLYLSLEKFMCGIFQSSIIAHTALNKNLLPFGYTPAPIAPGMWRNNINGVTLTLVLD